MGRIMFFAALAGLLLVLTVATVGVIDLVLIFASESKMRSWKIGSIVLLVLFITTFLWVMIFCMVIRVNIL